MTYTRQNVYHLGGDWADTILWYARSVARMQQRSLDDQLSWGFYAAIHGFDRARWQQVRAATTPLPTSGVQATFWNQCQHGSWYFLPWHRGYLHALEANLRAIVIELDGPADWALPYWNYFAAGESTLPPAFASPDWPDGTGDNPLFTWARFGPDGKGHVHVPLDQVNLLAIGDPDFTGVSSGGSPGFGGVDTGFSHGGRLHGGIETQPHDYVHGLVGGRDAKDATLMGAMSDPRTAALDPIFWLHHANIDRLWEAWTSAGPPHLDPTDPAWLAGPASVGERPFCVPLPSGATWTYTPAEVVSVTFLDYQYDDLTPALAPLAAVSASATGTGGLGDTGAAPLAAAGGGDGGGTGGAGGAAGVGSGAGGPSRAADVELVGASDPHVPVSGTGVTRTVRLDPAGRGRVLAAGPAAHAESPDASASEQAAPDRFFLNLEDVRGVSDAAAFKVYVGLTDDDDPAGHPDRLAGSIAPFGLAQATDPDGEHAGQGLTFVLEITDLLRRVGGGSALDVDELPVRIVALRPIPQAAALTVGRVSIYRQGR
jgi:tyrosinase